MLKWGYDKTGLNTGQSIVADLVASIIMLLIFTLGGLLFDYVFGPIEKNRKASGAFIFIVLVPLVTLGAAVGRLLVYNFLILKWQDK